MTNELAAACDSSDRDPDPESVLASIRRWAPEMRPDRAIRRTRPVAVPAA